MSLCHSLVYPVKSARRECVVAQRSLVIVIFTCRTDDAACQTAGLDCKIGDDAAVCIRSCEDRSSSICILCRSEGDAGNFLTFESLILQSEFHYRHLRLETQSRKIVPVLLFLRSEGRLHIMISLKTFLCAGLAGKCCLAGRRIGESVFASCQGRKCHTTGLVLKVSCLGTNRVVGPVESVGRFIYPDSYLVLRVPMHLSTCSAVITECDFRHTLGHYSMDKHSIFLESRTGWSLRRYGIIITRYRKCHSHHHGSGKYSRFHDFPVLKINTNLH